MSGEAVIARGIALWVVVLLSVSVPADAQDLDRARARDIETAGYYELQSWAETLGIATDGSRSDLQQRLADYYEVEIEVDESSRSDSREVRIEAAEDLQYFTVDDVEEEYIRLSGGVRLELSDRDGEARHRIDADEVVLNQDEEILSAYGSVLYEIERDGETERFEGESLTVELDTWAGGFLYGTSSRPREIEGERLNFRFSGSSITRNAEDVIVIEDGEITSSRADPPYYNISASRIWVLEPGDWALTNGVLYVGRVPMFYFPAFFYPGRPNILNLSFGFRDRDGGYVQTTYYLRGEPESGETDAPSILQLAGEEAETDRVREGLFLRPAEEGESVERSDDTIRIFADVYSNLGALLALDVVLADPPAVDDFEFFGGIGATRLQYDVAGSDRRTTFYLDEDGKSRQHWSSSQFPGLDAPFRFAADLSTSGSIGGLDTSLDLPVYSDPAFERDLLRREEQIDWGNIVGLSDTEETPPSERSTLNWRLRGSYRPEVETLDPWVTTADLRSADVLVQWRRRTIDETRLEPFETAALDAPAGAFFYPDTITAPDLSARLAGTLLASDREAGDGNVSDPRDSGRLRPPTYDTDEGGRTDELEPSDGDASGDDSDTLSVLDEDRPTPGGGDVIDSDRLRVVPPREADSISPPADPVEYGLRYTVTPALSYEARTEGGARANEIRWEVPQDVDWNVAYWEEQRRFSGSLDWTSAYLDPLVSVDSSLSLSDRRLRRFDFSQTIDEADRDSLAERAARGDRTNVDASTQLSLAPLEQLPLFRGTRTRYDIDVRLLDRTLERFEDGQPTYDVRTAEWDDERITAHNLNATLAANTLGTRQTLGIRYNLPPKDERATADLDLRTGPLRTRVRAGYTREREAEELVWEPLRVTETLSLGETGNISQEIEYDLNEDFVDSTQSDLAAGAFTARFEAERNERFVFDDEQVDWVGDEDVRLRPSSVSARFSGDMEPDPLWKNRIESDFGLTASLSADLLRYTDSTLDLRAQADVNVFRFLDLNISARSQNAQMYQYVPGLAERVGRDTRNILVDVGRSFNFLSREDREFSSFNIRDLSIDAVHDLGDWDLTVAYRGSPAQRRENAQTIVEWESRLDISLDWRPIPEISRSFEYEDGAVDW